MSKRLFVFPCSVLILLVSALSLIAQAPVAKAAPSPTTPIFPLKDVHAGLRGVGETVFSGDRPQSFQVEILGVINNLGPKQAVILAKLSGGPLADTGVLEGMSGSPVYIDGKLLGAVALGFPFAKTAIAGITPIEQMIAQQQQGADEARAQTNAYATLQLTAAHGELELLDPKPPALLPGAPAPESVNFGSATLPQLHTPLVLAGFTARAVAHFLPQLQALGLTPMLGGIAGSAAPRESDRLGKPSDLKPGDMISVQLLRGDLEVAAQGTVTYIHGRHVYAFGHRFLGAGQTTLPFTKADVVALMPGYMTSFKIAVSGERLGVIRQDRSQGVYGTFGGTAPMIPVTIRVHAADAPPQIYHFEMVNDKMLSPVLFNMGVFATLDATERSIGPATLSVRGAIHLTGAPDVTIGQLFSGNVNGPAAAAMAAATPLAFLYRSGLDTIHVRGIDLDVTSSDQERVLNLEQVWSDRREVEPGQRFTVTAILEAPDGSEVAKRVPIQLPASLRAGELHIIVGDGQALDALEMRELQQGFDARHVGQLVRAINHLRRNDRLYLRVTQPELAYALAGEQFPAPPPSLARALAAVPSVDSDIAPVFSSTLFDYASEDLPFVVKGAKVITVQVKDSD